MTEQDRLNAIEIGKLSTLPSQMEALTSTVNDNQATLGGIATSLATFASIKDGLDRLGAMYQSAQEQYKKDRISDEEDRRAMKADILALQQRPANEALALSRKIKGTLAVVLSIAFMWFLLGGKP